MNLTTTEAAFDVLDSQHSQMEDDLIALANINSGSSNLPGLLRVADWLESWADFAEAEFARVTLPTSAFVLDDGTSQPFETGPVLRWDFQPQAERRVLLAIHYDTVFGPESPFQEVTKLGEGRLNGPGVADAKGGIIVLRNALQALRQGSLMGDVGWTVVLNPDEEIGSLSSSGYLQEIASEFDFGLLFEPALPTGELVSARKGSGNFDIVVRGKAAHAGRHFSDGRNAVAMLSRLMVQLDALNGTREGATINVGYVHGGGAVNIVPDLAVGRFNVRLQDVESVAWFERTVAGLVDIANGEEGFEVTLHGGVTSPPKEVTPASQHLMQAVESAVQNVTNTEVTWKSTGGVCDGNKLAAAGLVNIDTMGPVGDCLHSDREWVQVDSLVWKAKVVVQLLADYAAGKLPDLIRG